jgi:hypothetical protein
MKEKVLNISRKICEIIEPGDHYIPIKFKNTGDPTFFYWKSDNDKPDTMFSIKNEIKVEIKSEEEKNFLMSFSRDLFC